MLFVEEIVGLLAGVGLGLIGWFFNFIAHKPYCMWLKALYVLACSIGPIMGAELVGWTNSKFLGGLFFGYTCYRVWGEEGKPKP